MMNGTTHSHDPSIGFYTGNGPIPSSYQTQYPSTFTTNVHLQQLYPSNRRESINRLPIQSNHVNQQAATANVYNFQNGASTSADYYNRIHAQTRSNTPGTYPNSTNNTTNSNFQQTYIYPPTPNLVRQPTPAVPNEHLEPTFLVVPAAEINGTISPVPVIHRFDPKIHHKLFFSVHHQHSLQSHYLIIKLHQIKSPVMLIHHLII